MPLYPPGSDSGGPVFGSDFSYATDETETSTTSGVYQDKLTITTPAWTGTYRLGMSGILRMGAANKLGWVRVYNVTDAIVEWEGNLRPTLSTVQNPFSGFHFVALTGVAKVYKMQYRSDSSGDTTYLSKANMELWRVI